MTTKEPGGPFSTKLGKKYHVVFIRQCDTEPKAGNYVYRLLTEEEKTGFFARTRWQSWLKGPYQIENTSPPYSREVFLFFLLR